MDIIVPSPSATPMNSETKQNGGKTSPPVVNCDDPPQPQQQQQQQQQQRPTRYINNSTLVGGVNKINSRSNSSTTKNKSLVRSHAVRESESEETSPPPDVPNAIVSINPSIISNNKNGKLRQQSSQQSSSLESSLSLDNNVGGEKQGQGNEDNELLEFIIDTLNKNAKDRTLILRIEADLISFIKDPKKTSHNFPAMTSYQRMLVHRVSGYFHLEHNIDTSAQGVVVIKTKSTRVPETRFKDYIDEQQQLQESNNKTVVLKRENAGSRKSNDDQNLHGVNKSRKSLEERAEDYNRVRRRIFNAEHDPGAYCWSSSTESNTTNDPHGKQQNNMRHMHRRSNAQPSSTLLKVESFETATINRKNKPPVVNKSYSFGGYGATDGSNVVVGASNNMGLNRFSKQDSSSSSSGLSPASSGYKSQSFQSSTENTMTTPNSSTSPQNLAIQEQPGLLAVEALTPQTAAVAAHHPCVVATQGGQPQSHQPAQQYYYYPSSSNSLVAASGLMQGVPLQMQPPPPQNHQQNPSQAEVVLWAVGAPGSVYAHGGNVLIDPNSGQALKNSDGTMYHFDPSNPPKPVLSQPQSSELVMYHGQPHQQSIQQPQLVNTPGGDVDHMTQWISHMSIQQPPQQQMAGHQWGDEYYVAPPPQAQPASAGYVTGAPVLWDPNKIATGAIGLNQQYYVNNPAHLHHPPPSQQQQQHFLMATPPNATQQHPVMMQYSVPTSSATPYMSYMLQPYTPIVAANYNNYYGHQPTQPQPQRPLHHNTVHQQPVKLNKDYCYVQPTSTTPTPATSNTTCLYNPFYGNAAVAAAAAAHARNLDSFQNQQPGGHRFPGNPPAMYPAPFIPRPGSGHNYRTYVKPRRGGNRTRNFSSSNDRSSQQQQQQQQHQSSDKNS